MVLVLSSAKFNIGPYGKYMKIFLSEFT